MGRGSTAAPVLIAWPKENRMASRILGSRRVALLVGLALAAPHGFADDRCAEWVGGVAPGLGLDATVRALVVFDDGTGAALFAAGDFKIAGAVSAHHVVKW